MRINTREGVIGPRGGGNQKTFIAKNLAREREMLDRNGNVIDPRTKRIIRLADEKQ